MKVSEVSWSLCRFMKSGLHLLLQVFIGGLPYNVTQSSLKTLFGGLCVQAVQIPCPREENGGRQPGHAYLVFEHQQDVHRLLRNCTLREAGSYFVWVCITIADSSAAGHLRGGAVYADGSCKPY